jgi:hypothetical protein
MLHLVSQRTILLLQNGNNACSGTQLTDTVNFGRI